jgi:2-polyprenyl-3-methyl-5-hydroxy-6-metoxy-1,4-benzoquinol methylase
MARARFVLSVLRHRIARQPRSCPYCGSLDTVRLARKKLLLELRHCHHCALKFRWPKGDAASSRSFYERAYREGLTTDLPSLEALGRLLETEFRGTPLDRSRDIALIRREAPAGRLLDFGASWGYGVYQFRRAGYDAVGYEISRPRAAYGRAHLGVNIIDTPADLDALGTGPFDIVYARHVLEHLADPGDAFRVFNRLIRPGGLLVIFVPNAGGASARSLGVRWGPLIGEKHPLALDAVFFARNLPAYGFVPTFRCSPYERPAVPACTPRLVEALPGDELMVVAYQGDRDA